jgi:hypothetical protein
LFSLSVPKVPFDEQDYFIEKIDDVRAAVNMSRAKLDQTKVMKSYFLNRNL